MSTLDQEIAALKNWTLAGSVTGGTNTVTVPNHAEEILVVVSRAGSQTYSNIRPALATFDHPWILGGYYVSSSDHGLCNINVSNSGKTFQIRNYRYAATDYKDSATMYVYYK